ncbi:transcriptional regulator, TetR family [Sphingobium faniae]|nr:transcriptional regulator, TetR family [Sphingobium faniae]
MATLKNQGIDVDEDMVPDRDEAVKPGRKSARRADRVREIILDVALECFSAHGFSGTSTRSIAKLAGVRHSLVNYHFETKDNLWIAMMVKALGEYARRVDEILDNDKSKNKAEKLKLYIEAYAKTAANTPQLLRIITQQSTQNSPRLEWLIENHTRKHFDMLSDLICGAQKEGAVIDGRPEHIFYLIVGTIGIFFAVPREYAALTGKDPFSAAEMHQVIDFVTQVIFTKKK